MDFRVFKGYFGLYCENEKFISRKKGSRASVTSKLKKQDQNVQYDRME